MIGTFEQMVKDMNNGTYNFCKKGKCIECGKCCSNILPMSPVEIDRIKAHIVEHNIQPTVRINALTVASFDMNCPFMDDVKSCHKCKIYEVRPQICRDFICDPKQRKAPKLADYMDVYFVDVRETFFERIKNSLEYQIVLDEVIKVLGKQISKKPLDFDNDAYLCPTCKRNNFYNKGYLVKEEICSVCGQKLRWE